MFVRHARSSGCCSTPVPARRGVLPAHSPGSGPAARLGAVAFIHRFGSTLNPHLHFHCVVIDGVFDAAAAGGVIVTAATGLDAHAIAQVQAQVRRRLLRSFMRRGLLPGDDARAMAQWEHGGGFSVDASVQIEAADRAGRERLLRYCARPPFALDRLRDLDPERLLYESNKPGPGGNGPLRLTPLELLDRLAALLPPPRLVHLGATSHNRSAFWPSRPSGIGDRLARPNRSSYYRIDGRRSGCRRSLRKHRMFEH
jgi:hypothetical protein